MAGRKSLPVSVQEQQFQDAFERWEGSGKVDKGAWDEMWLRVIECCRALALKIAPGKPLVEERSLDGAILVMDRIVRLQTHPRKLSSYCYWPVREALQGPKVVREDMELQLYEEYEEQKRDEIRGVCREDLMNTID